jgi:hypothetical protein
MTADFIRAPFSLDWMQRGAAMFPPDQLSA